MLKIPSKSNTNLTISGSIQRDKINYFQARASIIRILVYGPNVKSIIANTITCFINITILLCENICVNNSIFIFHLKWMSFVETNNIGLLRQCIYLEQNHQARESTLIDSLIDLLVKFSGGEG